MRNKKVLLIVQAALIAAIYVVLTYFISTRRYSITLCGSTYHMFNFNARWSFYCAALHTFSAGSAVEQSGIVIFQSIFGSRA